jgi:tRNA (mo5U34)-methyltransferase
MTPATDDLAAEVARVIWFHRIDLGRGLVTPGCDDTPAKLARTGLPADLTGRSVLDVGAWDGFFSFECERRGAKRVLAADWFPADGWPNRDGFDLARRALGSRVEHRTLDVLDLSPETAGVFDVVLLLGVLYHMKHPLLALERLASVCGGMLILETHVDLLDCPRPAMAFYPGTEVNGDPTNWCGPNPPMIEAMLRTVGFRKVVLHAGPYDASPRHPPLRQRLGEAYRRWRDGPFHLPPRSPRVVFHAWR